MKRIACLLLLFSGFAYGSTSVLTNTIVTDPDGQTWNNGTFAATLVSPNGPPTISRVAVTPTFVSGSMTSSGQIVATLTSTNSLDQSGATWCFVLTPNASVSPTQICTAVTGATPNLSTTLSAVPAPRFASSATAYGYLDVEVINPLLGSIYFNVTSSCLKTYTQSGWPTCGGGSSGTVTNIATTSPLGGGPITTTGTMTCATCVTSAASLTSGALMTGAGSQASQTVTTGTGVTTALGVNTGTAGAFGVVIASGTSALGTSLIASTACATVVTTTATGTASTDAITWNPNGSIKAVTGYVPLTSGGLSIAAYPTTNAVNFDVCNWSNASITPGAVTLNWRVVR